MVDDFIDRKHGRKKVEYDHPSLEPILQGHLRRHRLPGAGHADLVGAGRLLAGQGRSLPPRDGQEEGRGHGQGEGRLPRRAPSRKASTPKIAERVFDLMEKFAGYGFNRSHSAAYGLLTYQTAYLKHYYPVEFFAALLTCDKDDTDAVVKFIAEAQGPRHRGAAARRQRARQRLHGGAVPSASRRASGRRRPSASAWARSRAWAKAPSRSIQAARARGRALPVAVRLLQARRRPQGQPQGDRGAGQVGRLRRPGRRRRRQPRARCYARHRPGVAIAPPPPSATRRAARPACWRCSAAAAAAAATAAATAIGQRRRAYPDADEWLPKEMLAYEKESLGFYISGHPLDRFAGRDPPLHHRHHRQLHGEGGARRGDPGRRGGRLPGTHR